MENANDTTTTAAPDVFDPLQQPSLKAAQVARAFHEYICHHDDDDGKAIRERAADRDGTHKVFVEFYQHTYSSDPTTTNNSGSNRRGFDQKLRLLESMVMAKLRQQKLLRTYKVHNHNNTTRPERDQPQPPTNQKKNTKRNSNNKKDKKQSNNNNNNNNKNKNNSPTIVMVFADANGELPSMEERVSLQDRLLQQKIQSEQDKHGVSLLLRPGEEAQTICIGDETATTTTTTTEPATCHFFLKWNPEHQPEEPHPQLQLGLPTNNNDPDSPSDSNNSVHVDIQLESITLHGPHRQHYKLEIPFALPWSLTEDPVTRAFTTTVLPKHISVLRCKVQCNFVLTRTAQSSTSTTNNSNDPSSRRETFQIARYISTKGTLNAALEQALQPQTMYQRKKTRKRTQIDQVVPPPDDDDDKKKNKYKKKNKGQPGENNDNDDNPLEKLPKFYAPKEIRELLEAKELENVLEKPHVAVVAADDNDNETDSPTAATLEGYATFWQNLLWALEHQARIDIQWYDMNQVHLQREGGGGRNHVAQFLLTVPGLAENRPSVLRGDLIRVIHPARRLNLGRVTEIRQLQVKLALHAKFAKHFHPATDTVNIQFALSRTTYRTSHYGIQKAEETMKALLLQPSSELYHQHASKHWIPPRIVSNSTQQEASLNWANRDLNPEQQMAVRNVVLGTARPMPYCIFGPPGTGKTTTLIEAVYQLANVCQLKLLVVAPSNDAADILVERLSTYFPPSELKRILAYSRSIETVPHTIRPYAVELKGDDVPTSGGNRNNKNQPRQRQQKQQQSEQHVQCSEILSGRIVVATVNLAARFSWMGVPRGHFDVLCVDEAGHATEPEVIAVAATLMQFWNDTDSRSDPTPGTGQLVLAGDPRQLGPVVTSELCRRFGLEISYMERLMMTHNVYQRENNESEDHPNDDGTNTNNNTPPNHRFPEELVTKLVRNYRSHPSIIKLPNEMFYDGELQASADQMVSHNMSKWEHLPVQGFPIIFHGVDGENHREGNSPSWFNPQEVMQVVQYVKLLLQETRPALTHDDIGIITPYHRQAQKIRWALVMEGLSFSSSVDGNAGTMGSRGIKVGSVETFQGQERRCIIVSTVRADVEHVASDLKYNLGFVANEKRFNVTVTRAKALLIVIGCPSVLALDRDNWFPFLKYCHEHKAWNGEAWDPNEVLPESEIFQQVRNENQKKNDRQALSQGNDDGVEDDAQLELVDEGFAFINREE